MIRIAQGSYKLPSQMSLTLATYPLLPAWLSLLILPLLSFITTRLPLPIVMVLR